MRAIILNAIKYTIFLFNELNRFEAQRPWKARLVATFVPFDTWSCDMNLIHIIKPFCFCNKLPIVNIILPSTTRSPRQQYPSFPFSTKILYAYPFHVCYRLYRSYPSLSYYPNFLVCDVKNVAILCFMGLIHTLVSCLSKSLHLPLSCFSYACKNSGNRSRNLHEIWYCGF